MTIKEFLFSSKYGSLCYIIEHRLPFTKTWNLYHNPLYYWWKTREYFKRPKAHFHCGKMVWFFGFPCRRDYLNPIIDFRISSLGWKNKWENCVHEWDPYISIVLFRKWQLLWTFNWIKEEDAFSHIRSIATWEAMLDYFYNKLSIEECIKRHTWEGNKHGKEYKITILPNIN